MTLETLREISRRPAEIQPELRNAEARYEGTRIPLTGLATVDFTRESIYAYIVNSGEWNTSMFMSMEPGSMQQIGGFFRDVAPSFLLGPGAGGIIVPVGGGWEARDAKWIGEGSSADPPGDRFRFNIGSVVIDGPAAGKVAASCRLLYGGGEWDLDTTFAGNTLLVRELTDGALRREDETLSAAIDRTLNDLEQHALWVLLSFITGNRLNSLATEFYCDSGALIRTVHRRGANVSVGRGEIFHRHHGPLTSRGLQLLEAGILRLMVAPQPFPIENVIHHLLDANTGNVDTDAQHLVLAIHAAFEAWNRTYGRNEWIEDRPWKGMARRIRHSISEEAYEAIPADVRCEIVRNIVSDVNHSNRTTSGWRQRSMFDALQIDVSDGDNRRALKLRDELIHNGYFLTRWRQLTQVQAQERMDDIQRLRRLAILIILRLTAFEGRFVNPVRLQGENVTPVPLPPDIAPPVEV